MKRLAYLFPLTVPGGYRERVRAAVGAFIGLGITAWIATVYAPAAGDLPLLIAPMGASAVLLFTIPASPLAQPWPFIGGNVISAVIGVTAAHMISSTFLAASVAIGLAVAAMSFLRCVHPPSGAVALTAVLGGQRIFESGYGFVLMPVLMNSVLLALAAMVYNNATGRSYPHLAHQPVHPHPPERKLVLTETDFDEVLADYGETLDISRDDLQKLYVELLGRAEERRKLLDRK